jgi:hypothetical protein
MLADRSSKIRITSGAAPIIHPIHPPASGRLIASNKTRTANVRNNKIKNWRNRAYRVDFRVADRKNIIAAHGIDRCRNRLNR